MVSQALGSNIIWFWSAVGASLSSGLSCLWGAQWCCSQEVWSRGLVSCITEVPGACVMLKLHWLSVPEPWNPLWPEKGLYIPYHNFQPLPCLTAWTAHWLDNLKHGGICGENIDLILQVVFFWVGLIHTFSCPPLFLSPAPFSFVKHVIQCSLGAWLQFAFIWVKVPRLLGLFSYHDFLVRSQIIQPMVQLMDCRRRTKWSIMFISWIQLSQQQSAPFVAFLRTIRQKMV